MAQTINTEDHRSDLSTVEARQAVTTGRVRYILGISVALVVIAFFAIWANYYTPL
jgi:hypothetical protein